MKQEHARSLFEMAGFEIQNMWQLPNEYWSDHEMQLKSPWWLVKTVYGNIQIGWRKRVVSIDWSDTNLKEIITEDDVTKSDVMVHAYGYIYVLKYLTDLNKRLKALKHREENEQVEHVHQN